MVSPEPAESWSWRCRWWSDWKVSADGFRQESSLSCTEFSFPQSLHWKQFSPTQYVQFFIHSMTWSQTLSLPISVSLAPGGTWSNEILQWRHYGFACKICNANRNHFYTSFYLLEGISFSNDFLFNTIPLLLNLRQCIVFLNLLQYHN